MVFGPDLVQRLVQKNRASWKAFGEVASSVGIEGDPFLDLKTSYAFYAGEGSLLTQAGGRFEPEHIDGIHRFFRGRTTYWEAVVTPFAHENALNALLSAGAKLEGWESLLYQSLNGLSLDGPEDGRIVIEEADERTRPLWEGLANEGFFGERLTEAGRVVTQLMARTPQARRYIASWEGEPAGIGTLSISEGIGMLGGMATLPPFQNRGIQTALIKRRLRDAFTDCDTAMIGASPGTSSHRNAERAGFRVAFSQLSLRVPTRS